MRLALILIFCFFACTAVNSFEAPPESSLQCDDGLDNDGNDLVDCEEAACAAEDVCQAATPFCGDGVAEGEESCDDADETIRGGAFRSNRCLGAVIEGCRSRTRGGGPCSSCPRSR